MKKNITFLATAFILFITSQACGNKKNADLSAANYYSMGDTVVMAEGQAVRYYEKEGWDITVKFDSLIGKDSRCPKGANCIWEGNAAIAISMTASKSMKSITLNTNTSMTTSDIFNGYTVELINVSPYPTKDKPSENTATMAHIKVTQ